MAGKDVKQRVGKGGWIFLFIVVLCYAIAALFDVGLAVRALELFNRLLMKMLPILLLVFLLLFLINLFLNPGRVKRYLGKQSGIKGWLMAMAAGVFSTGPIYAWYAVLKDLRQKGMRSALVSVMLYSRAVKLPMLPLLVHYFGLAYTVVLVVYLLLFSIFSGLIMERMGIYTEPTSMDK